MYRLILRNWMSPHKPEFTEWLKLMTETAAFEMMIAMGHRGPQERKADGHVVECMRHSRGSLETGGEGITSTVCESTIAAPSDPADNPGPSESTIAVPSDPADCPGPSESTIASPQILLTAQAHLSPPLQSPQILLTAQAHLSPPLQSPQILLTAQAHLQSPQILLTAQAHLQSPQILLTAQAHLQSPQILLTAQAHLITCDPLDQPKGCQWEFYKENTFSSVLKMMRSQTASTESQQGREVKSVRNQGITKWTDRTPTDSCRDGGGRGEGRKGRGEGGKWGGSFRKRKHLSPELAVGQQAQVFHFWMAGSWSNSATVVVMWLTLMSDPRVSLVIRDFLDVFMRIMRENLRSTAAEEGERVTMMYTRTSFTSGWFSFDEALKRTERQLLFGDIKRCVEHGFQLVVHIFCLLLESHKHWPCAFLCDLFPLNAEKVSSILRVSMDDPETKFIHSHVQVQFCSFDLLFQQCLFHFDVSLGGNLVFEILQLPLDAVYTGRHAVHLALHL
ncbi:hypothetical protein F7725_022195 [Dissostichus mawsoni]|uniref:Uncharacterized protein n=1 Tax=Dissostichus mawsoni TaxID=36200 RepID=A0A7J5YXE1_DISMA|nr:hypothetical protein F7725_022195 [Dissostichus mawsoni]